MKNFILFAAVFFLTVSGQVWSQPSQVGQEAYPKPFMNGKPLTQLGFRSLIQGESTEGWEMLAGHAGHWVFTDGLIDYDGKSGEKDKCLWTTEEFCDFVLVADVKLTRTPEMAKSPVILSNGDNAINADGTNKEAEILYNGDTGIYLRGSSKNQINIGNRYIGSGEIYGYRVDKKLPASVREAVTPSIRADNPPGSWNRFVITMKGDRVTVVLNGKKVVDSAWLPGISSCGKIALQDDHADNNLFQFANLYIKKLN
jgi:hypothetical protein